MGIFISTEQRRAQVRAKSIRQDLHSRAKAFLQEYETEFQGIGQTKKNLIKSSSATKLCELMDNKKVSSYEVVLTFIERAIKVGIKNNYVMDEMFREAVEMAKRCDSLRQEFPHRKSWTLETKQQQHFPPFFGVPISIKESILMKDTISYVGFSNSYQKYQNQDSNIVRMVHKMGFIPFVRSSVPQANHSYETNNNILGYCKNPWDETRSCAGSSGGEAGLVASYSSPFGLGSDLFGDTKVPCEFTGCATLKPYSRYSNFGNAFIGKYVQGLPFRQQFCPIAHYVEDIIKWNQFMYDQSNYQDIPLRLKDPFLKLSEFKLNVFNSTKPKRIGYLINFSQQIKCSPSHGRAVKESLKILQDKGHSTFEIELSKAQYLNSLLFKLLYANKRLSIFNENRSGQKHIKQFNRFLFYSKIPKFLLFIICKIIKSFKPKIAHQLSLLREFSMKEYYIIIHEINLIKKQVYQYLQSNKIDAIITPGFFMPAYKLGQSSQFTYYSTYATLWSLLHYPVGSLPISVVRPNEQFFEDYVMDGVAKQANRNMLGSEGMPVGIQIISYPGQEELILNLMKTIQKEVDFNKKHKSRCFSAQII